MDFAAVLRAAGCGVQEVGGWRDRGHGMGLVAEGVMLHHTASGAPTGSEVDTVVKGRQGLAGPLANLTLDRNGVWWIVAAGVAYHAGSGSSVVLGRVRRRLAPQGDAAKLGLVDDYTGNTHWIGVEIQNTGTGEPYPQVQMDALRTGVNALLRTAGWGPWACVGHKEHTRRKIDPSFDMAAFRASLAAPAPGPSVVVQPPVEVPPATPTLEEASMPATFPYANQRHIVRVEGDGVLSHRWTGPDGVFGAEKLADGCATGSAPVVVLDDFGATGRIDVWANAEAGGLVHAWFDGTAWKSERVA